MVEIKGGDKLTAALNDIARKLGKKAAVNVGFLDGATYPDSGRDRTRARYAAKRKKGDMKALKGAEGGVSVPMVAAIQEYGAPAAGIPARPFFRNMIREKSPEWGAAVGAALKANDYDAKKALGQTGELIAGQLKVSITETNSPALAQKTIDEKGFAKPLVDTGHMLASVDYEVKS